MNCNLFIPLLLLASAGLAEEWTRFRGPNGSGISTGTGFPAEFHKEKNLIWRTPVRPGKSSPILTRRHVFLTALDQGKLFTQCFDRDNGKGMTITVGRLFPDNIFDYRFVALSHNTIRGAAGGSILNAELLVAAGAVR